MVKKHNFYNSIWTIKHLRKGKEIWRIEKRNSLVDQGEEGLLESFFRGNASYTPTEFYIRLCNDNLIETDTLIDVQNEPSSNGYSAQLIERSTVGFPTKDLSDGDYRITSKEVTFTATGGNIGPITTAYLATTSNNVGKLIAFVDLAMTRTILEDDSMVIDMKIKLQ